jgi:hypothetical protein
MNVMLPEHPQRHGIPNRKLYMKTTDNTIICIGEYFGHGDPNLQLISRVKT